MERINSLGRHLLVEYYDCDADVLDSVEQISAAMVKAAELSGATVINNTFHHFSPFGVSGVVVIAESHLSIHTWPEYGFAAVDLFTCGDDVDPWIGFNYLKDVLKSKYFTVMEMRRGLIETKNGKLLFKPVSSEQLSHNRI
ncbi:MAG: adenosylmethionine decarboxylase [Spirochaetes bacterium]|nr:adenosylmethionine decarboxylase [Spirochaetota bacterium]MCX8096987.1 adenosylmethionine decarboxylase [Spirochaetota bacterium]